MAKKGRPKKTKLACKTTAKVVGNHVTVKATCPIKSKVVKTPCAPRKKYTKKPVPRVCKGLAGIALKECKKIMRKEYQIRLK